MNQENVKIGRIKRSCNVASIVTKILFMVCVVASVILVITGIVMIANRKKMNAQMQSAIENRTEVDVQRKVGGLNIHLFKIAPGSIDISKYGEIDSSIPALKEIMNETPYSLSLGFTLLSVGFNVVLLTIALFQLYSVFDLIKKEESPFTTKVLKKLLIALIVIDVILLLSVGIGAGAIGGLITWALYSIMDYGRVLQIQSDETL